MNNDLITVSKASAMTCVFTLQTKSHFPPIASAWLNQTEPDRYSLNTGKQVEGYCQTEELDYWSDQLHPLQRRVLDQIITLLEMLATCQVSLTWD